MLIDTHCHLATFARDGSLPAVLERAVAAGVSRMITIGTGPEDWELYRQLAARHPGIIDWTVGIHPNEVAEGWEDAARTIATYFATDPLPVALGEVGLDYFRLPSAPDEAAEIRSRQVAAFRFQLELAYQLDCPVVVHSRAAFDDCVRLIDASGVDWRKVVFHCFSDAPERLHLLQQRGGRVSFTGVVTYPAKGGEPNRAADSMIAQGLEPLLLETDSPYLSPVPFRGKPNEPALLHHTAVFCAERLGCDLETLARQTSANARQLFGLRA